jgi:hypothetical protein
LTTTFMLERGRLLELAELNRMAYQSAVPFPHTVIDDFLPERVLEAVLDEFPGPSDIEWWAFDDARERKLGSRDDRTMGPATRQLFGELNSAVAIDWLEAMTGIDGLVPDPHLLGGGLHQIERGGFLKVHADFNLHPQTKLERRLNLLLYLNRNWRPEYGGALELWNPDMSRCVRRIDPIFNRCVVFSTNRDSYHGHPDPLTCPEGATRKSLALYYYSAPRGSTVAAGRSTVFRSRPGEEIVEGESTWGEPATGGAYASAWVRSALIRWLPPVVTDAIRARRQGGKGE